MPRKPTGKPAGRPPKSTEEHLREGTYRPSRHGPRGPVKLAESTPPPSDASLKALDALVSDPPPWWLPVDLILVAMLRESLKERVALRAEAVAGNLAASKELRALDAEVGRMLDSLGLTPTSRKRLDVELPKEESRLEALRRRGRTPHVTAVEVPKRPT